MTGQELREIREAMSLTQAELAVKLGVRTNTVARWEQERLKMSAMAEKFIRLLRCLHELDAKPREDITP